MRRRVVWCEAGNRLPWCMVTWEAGRTRREGTARTILYLPKPRNSYICTRNYQWGHWCIRYSLSLWLWVFFASNLDMNENLGPHCTQTRAWNSENYLKWRWIKRGKLTANVRCKEVRHMHLHSCLSFSPSVSCEHFEWNALDLQSSGTFIFSGLLERGEHFAVVW